MNTGATTRGYINSNRDILASVTASGWVGNALFTVFATCARPHAR